MTLELEILLRVAATGTPVKARAIRRRLGVCAGTSPLRLLPGGRAVQPWQLGRRPFATAADERISRTQPC